MNGIINIINIKDVKMLPFKDLSRQLCGYSFSVRDSFVNHHYSIVHKDAQIFLGCGGLIHNGENCMEVYCKIYPPYQNQGVGTWIIHRLRHIAFTRLKTERLIAFSPPYLGAATRVLQKSKFEIVDATTTGEMGLRWMWEYGNY